MTEVIAPAPLPEQQAPEPAPAKQPRFKKNHVILASAVAAGLLVGGLAGGAIGGAGKAKCVEALDAADAGFGIAAKTIGYATDGLKAASNFNISDMRDASDGMKTQSEKIGDLTPKYKEASKACRG